MRCSLAPCWPSSAMWPAGKQFQAAGGSTSFHSRVATASWVSVSGGTTGWSLNRGRWEYGIQLVHQLAAFCECQKHLHMAPGDTHMVGPGGMQHLDDDARCVFAHDLSGHLTAALAHCPARDCGVVKRRTWRRQ